MTRLPMFPVLVAALATGCAPWTVVRQGTALPPSTQLAVAEPTYDALLVGKLAETAYLANRPPEDVEAWQAGKRAFDKAFTQTVLAHRNALDVTGPDHTAGRALVHAHVTMIEPGEHDGLLTASTEIRTRVTITDASHGPIDEIELRCVVPADDYRPAVTDRITECAKETARNTARYLNERLR